MTSSSSSVSSLLGLSSIFSLSRPKDVSMPLSEFTIIAQTVSEEERKVEAGTVSSSLAISGALSTC